jgi:hypothetical protein
VGCLLDGYNFGDEVAGHSDDGDEADHLHGAGGREEMAEGSVLCSRHGDGRFEERVVLRRKVMEPTGCPESTGDS